MFSSPRRWFVSFGVALAFCAATASNAAPGDLDTAGFGSGLGKVMTPIGSNNDVANAVALQPDGKIVVAGNCYNGANEDFCLARYLPSGALDTSFNTTGKLMTPIGSSSDIANALALQPDGKIVVAGYCSNDGNNDFCLARYLPSGALDTSFNATGTVITPIGLSYDYANAVALQPDGKIVVAGYCSNGTNSDFCLARYLPNGALDTSFNTTGKVITPFGSGDDYARAVALQPDGKIVVAGDCYNGTYDFCLARFLPSGALDTNFNTTGTVITPVGSGSDTAYAVALQPDGKIVVTGVCFGSTNFDFCLARYLPSGALDTSFNTTGTVITSVGSSFDTAYGVALQPDGKIVVAGFCLTPISHFCLARYLPSGTLDTSFNTTGKVITSIGSGDDFARAVALRPDGKIVVAGGCSDGTNNDFCLARYEGGPFDARNCSMDIDGDGLVLATTDSLIHARVALGITGPAVMGGITFAPHATRNTWPLIRDYLVTQCGMSLVQ